MTWAEQKAQEIFHDWETAYGPGTGESIALAIRAAIEEAAKRCEDEAAALERLANSLWLHRKSAAETTRFAHKSQACRERAARIRAMLTEEVPGE